MSKRKKFGISKSLSDGLSHTVQAVANNAGSLRYEVVPLSWVELDPDNPRDLMLSLDDLPEGPQVIDPDYERKLKEKASLQSLVHSIQQQGVINPVWLYKHGDKYRLVAGERRVLAATIAERDDIPAKVVSQKPAEADLRLIQWFENMERSDLSLWERISNLELILKAHQAHDGTSVTATTLKNWLGCSLPQAMHYHAVLFASDDIKIAVQRGQISSLEKASLLSQYKTQPWFAELKAQCLSGVPLRKMQAWVASQRQRLNLTSSKETRGRKAQAIQLGSVQNPKIVSQLVHMVLSHEAYAHHEAQFSSVNWTDYKSASQAFKQLLVLMDKIEG